MEIRHYVTRDGVDYFQNWLDRLKDIRARVAVLRRVDRVIAGNFGDHRFCGEGVWELRIDVGPGYRVYYALAGTTIVLLLCAGSKRSQTVDIRRATSFWKDYRQRQP
jgi:putative addiction module killer protein